MFSADGKLSGDIRIKELEAAILDNRLPDLEELLKEYHFSEQVLNDMLFKIVADKNKFTRTHIINTHNMMRALLNAGANPYTKRSGGKKSVKEYAAELVRPIYSENSPRNVEPGLTLLKATLSSNDDVLSRIDRTTLLSDIRFYAEKDLPFFLHATRTRKFFDQNRTETLASMLKLECYSFGFSVTKSLRKSDNYFQMCALTAAGADLKEAIVCLSKNKKVATHYKKMNTDIAQLEKKRGDTELEQDANMVNYGYKIWEKITSDEKKNESKLVEALNEGTMSYLNNSTNKLHWCFFDKGRTKALTFLADLKSDKPLLESLNDTIFNTHEGGYNQNSLRYYVLEALVKLIDPENTHPFNNNGTFDRSRMVILFNTLKYKLQSSQTQYSKEFEDQTKLTKEKASPIHMGR